MGVFSHFLTFVVEIVIGTIIYCAIVKGFLFPEAPWPWSGLMKRHACPVARPEVQPPEDEDETEAEAEPQVAFMVPDLPILR